MTDREKWFKLMDEMCTLYKAWDYKAATVKGEAALTLIDGLSIEEKSTTLNQLAELYAAQGLYDRATTQLHDRATTLHNHSTTDEEHLFSDTAKSAIKRTLSVIRSFGLIFRQSSTFAKKLVHTGYVDAKQLDQALVDSRTSRKSLIEVLEILTDRRLPIEVQEAYKKQRLFELKVVYGIDAVDIESTTFFKSEVNRLTWLFDGIDICRQLEILPISITDGNPSMLTVAMIYPANLQTRDNLSKILHRQGIAWRSQVIAPEDYQQLLDGYFDKQKQVAGRTLYNQAVSYHNQEQYDLAEPLYKRALEIEEKVLGKEHLDVAITLYNLADIYKQQWSYDRAEPLYKRALEIQEKALGKEHLDVAITLQELALIYKGQGQYDRAEPLYDRILEIREKALGDEHLDVAITLQNLSFTCYKQRLYERAETLCKRALEIREKALGKEHLDVAITLQELALIYKEQGQYDRAEPLYDRILEIREKALGDEHPDVAIILQNLAFIYKEQGQYTRARLLLKLILLIREKALGTEHLDVATTLYNLANIYKEQELYDRAEPLYKRALEIQEKLLGKEHLDVAMTLDKLAELYRQQGLYERSKPLYERVLAIREKSLGKEHLDLASILNELAFLAQQQGLFTRAEPLYRRALTIQEKALGQEHSDTAKTLHGLAGLYQRQGLYERAEPLYQQALQISKTALGTEHPDIAAIFHGWAGLYKEQGLYERAEPLYQRALEISKKTLGEEHPHVAATLHHLAGLYQAQGLYKQAEEHYLEDLEISKKTLGDNHIDVATTLHHLADLYQMQRLPERAEPFYLKTLEIREKALGKKHPYVAATLNSLAGLYQARGDHSDAEPRYKRALEIQETTLGKKHPDVANTLDDLAGLYRVQGLYSVSEPLYKRALGIKETALGQEHPSVATTLHHLAALYREQGRYDLALAHFQTALENQYNFIRKRLAHISEREHKLYLKDLKRTLTALLSLVYRHLNTDQSAIAIALKAVLLTKNLSTAALAARNVSVHSGNPQLQTKIQQIRELIAQSNHLAYDDSQQIQIREQMRALEIQIARIAPEVMLPEALEIDLLAIGLKLNLNSTLVEFIGFDTDDSTRYLAFVYSPGRSNRIRLIGLGLASEIDPLIGSCRRSILDIYNKLIKTAKSIIPNKIEEFPEIEEFLIESLEPVKVRIIELLQLDRVAHVIIAPDGALSFLPFQLFLPDSLVSYLNTGRDLLKKPSRKPVGDSIVIADPDFVNKPTDLYLLPSKPQIENDLFLAAGIKDLDDWKPLTSFGTLGTAIAAKLQVACHQQGQATKARLTQSQCPHILSILTHGFALPKTDADELDPMARSGLAFAGANHGTEYLLLANEVATLDLHNNELTLLVACQTALGDVTTGEGVYGLRRAFTLAGAKTLIATLWEIPVYTSVILIERFLDNLEQYMGKAAALKEAQMYLRDIDVATLDRIPNGAGINALTELHGKNYDLDDAFRPFSHPYFWAAWICQGDTGAMKYLVLKDLGKFTVGGKVVNLRIQK